LIRSAPRSFRGYCDLLLSNYQTSVVIASLGRYENHLRLSPRRPVYEFQPVGVSVLLHLQAAGKVIPERLGFQPQSQSRIGDLWPIEPEAVLEIAADANVIELQIDRFYVVWEMTSGIGRLDPYTGDRMTIVLESDEHDPFLLC